MSGLSGCRIARNSGAEPKSTTSWCGPLSNNQTRTGGRTGGVVKEGGAASLHSLQRQIWWPSAYDQEGALAIGSLLVWLTRFEAACLSKDGCARSKQ